MVTHSSTPGEVPCTEELGGATVQPVTKLSDMTELAHKGTQAYQFLGLCVQTTLEFYNNYLKVGCRVYFASFICRTLYKGIAVRLIFFTKGEVVH